MSVIHNQQAEEPIGRWEDRCEAHIVEPNETVPTVVTVCDRRRGHVGLHRRQGVRAVAEVKPMSRYRPDDLPVTCAECGGRLRWIPDRYAWTHVVKGADHAPRPAGAVAR